jgi:hypothetical protein
MLATINREPGTTQIFNRLFDYKIFIIEQINKCANLLKSWMNINLQSNFLKTIKLNCGDTF